MHKIFALDRTSNLFHTNAKLKLDSKFLCNKINRNALSYQVSNNNNFINLKYKKYIESLNFKGNKMVSNSGSY